MKEQLIHLNKEYIKYRESLGKNLRKPLKYEQEWIDWCNYRDIKFPKSEYITKIFLFKQFLRFFII